MRARATTSRIKVNLAAVPADVDKIVFPVSIHDAETRGQSFGQVRNAFIRVVNQADGAEIARYDLSEDASTETAMVFGELYRNGAEWKFRAVGQGYASGLAGIASGLRRQRLRRTDSRPYRTPHRGRVRGPTHRETTWPTRLTSARRTERTSRTYCARR